MKYTTNYNLYKPDYDDTIDVDFLNKNMDVLDNQINGLDYVQNVNTSDNGIIFIKRNGDTIPVSLDYLKLTGGTVTGDTEFKGKLTNNGKDVGKMFNGSATIKSILDWDKMKEVYGSEMSSIATIYKGKQKTITYPNWCVFNANLGAYYFNMGNKSLYLTDDFTNYDEIGFHILGGAIFNGVIWRKTSQVLYLFENFGYINLGQINGVDYVFHGFYQYGVKPVTDVSTKTMFKYVDDSGYCLDVYGVKYDV